MGPFVMSVIGQLGLGVRITFSALHYWAPFSYWLAGLFYYNQLLKVQCKEMSLVSLIIYIFSLQWSSVKALNFLTSIL